MESAQDFLRAYELALNSHDLSKVRPLIAGDATFWFTDGSFTGRDAILGAIAQTWQTIQEEVFKIQQVEWLSISDDSAVCKYKFDWSGLVDGESEMGSGSGTSVFAKSNDVWQIVHEHLSH